MDEGGQTLGLAVLLLAVLLLASLAVIRSQTPIPQIVVKRDWVQAAELASLARFWIVTASYMGRFCPRVIRSSTLRLYELNETYGLDIPYTVNVTVLEKGILGNESGWVYFDVYFYRGPTYGDYYVRYYVRYEWRFRDCYIKYVKGEACEYANYSITYVHRIYGPWGLFVLTDLELKPESESGYPVDISYVGEGKWWVGFPSWWANCTFIDKFGVRVVVGG
mgnify:CR=1 FL=1